MINASDIISSPNQLAIITNAYDITYLTGFIFSDPHLREAILLADSKQLHLFTHTMFANQVTNLHQDVKYSVDDQLQGLWNLLIESIDQRQNYEILYQPNHLTVAEFQKLTKNLEFQLTTKPDLLTDSRSIKNKQEIKNITRATQITEAIIPELHALLSSTITERQLAWQIKNLLYQHGAHNIAFEPVVAYGTNTANPHHIATDKTLTEDTLILIDWGATYQGYHSDITRMWHLGPPREHIIKQYQQLLDIHQQIMADFSPHKFAKDLHQFTDQLLANNHLPTMIHSLGHGVGLEIHEAPKLSAKSEDTIQAFQTVTLEPAFYIREQYGMRIEDLVYHDGHSSVRLTQSNNQLHIIPS